MCASDIGWVLAAGPNGVWDLKKNFALIELLERVLANSSDARSATSASESAASPGDPGAAAGGGGGFFCDENESHSAVLYCTTCGTHLCHDCSESTHATRTLAKHRRIPLAEKPREKHKCSTHTMQVGGRTPSSFHCCSLFSLLCVYVYYYNEGVGVHVHGG